MMNDDYVKDDNEENDPSDTESEHEKSDSDQDDHFQGNQKLMGKGSWIHGFC